MKFRDKLTLLTITVVVVTIAVSMVIVGFTVRNQNQDSITKQIIKTIAVVDKELGELKKGILKSTEQIVAAAKAGEHIKFIYETSDFSTTRPSYSDVLNALYNAAQVNDFGMVSLYDREGGLRGCVSIKGKTATALMVAYEDKKSIYHYANVELGQSLPPSDGWVSKSELSIDASPQIGGMPDKSQTAFGQNKEGLSITTRVLAIARYYDAKTQKMSQKPFGVVIFTRDLKKAFAERIKSYTQSEINIYIKGKLASGTFEQAKTLNTSALSSIKPIGNIAGNPILPLEVVADGQSYSAGIYALGPKSAPVADLAALYSNGIAWQNTWQMIQVLAIIAVACILVIVPVTMFLANRMIKPITQSISALDQGARDVAHGSDQALESSNQVAHSSSSQAASIEETASSVEEVSSIIKSNADNAVQAKQHIDRVNEVFQQADLAMDEMTVSMQEIADASKETSKIIKTIDEISFQTNLLALNAAVEAARAGEAGAGFAVVADEVRSLAMRAAEAAKDTETMIQSTMSKVTVGSDLVKKTNDAFGEATETASQVTNLISEIAVASREQADGMSQINAAMNSMNQMVQDNASLTEQSARVSRDMSKWADEMRLEVRQLADFIQGKGKTAPKDADTGGEQEHQSERDGINKYRQRLIES